MAEREIARRATGLLPVDGYGLGAGSGCALFHPARSSALDFPPLSPNLPHRMAHGEPALRSRFGYSEHVPGARHATLLGLTYADAVVRAIEHVRDAHGDRLDLQAL